MTAAGDTAARHRLCQLLLQRIDRGLYLRLEMSAIAVLTALAGINASRALLGAGLRGMALRDPCEFAIAHLVFVVLMWSGCVFARRPASSRSSMRPAQAAKGSGRDPRAAVSQWRRQCVGLLECGNDLPRETRRTAVHR